MPILSSAMHCQPVTVDPNRKSTRQKEEIGNDILHLSAKSQEPKAKSQGDPLDEQTLDTYHDVHSQIPNDVFDGS